MLLLLRLVVVCVVGGAMREVSHLLSERSTPGAEDTGPRRRRLANASDRHQGARERVELTEEERSGAGERRRGESASRQED